jgi:putative spermidine/putrescine transport system ATP-binding protein
MALIELTGLRKVYAGSTAAAIDDLNLHIEAGEFITLLGPSGSGKTTTLMLLAGFETPSAGTIHLDGQPIDALPPHRRGMGVVFQSYSLFPHMTVEQNVAFPLSVRKVSSSDARAKVAAALDKVHLRHLGSRKPQQLSGGQQQRVALARALVFEPRVVLLDEPLSALDKKLREELQLEIRRLHRELGVTMVFVTHDQAEAMTLSDRVAVFNQGRIEQLATPQQLYDAPANPFVAGFIGDNNMLSGVADGNGALRLADGQCLRARAAQPPGAGATTSAPQGRGAAATLCLRPEHLRVFANGAQVGGDGNRLNATLLDAIHQGDHWRIVARLHGSQATWFAKLAPGALPSGLVPGQALELAFRGEDAWLFGA